MAPAWRSRKLANPLAYLLVLAAPLVVYGLSQWLGLAGGAFMSVVTLDISLNQYLDQLAGAIDFTTFMVGMVKAPVFAFIGGMIGCYEGLQVARSAESVGRQTTRAVVESIFLVIVLDALLSIFFSVIGF